MRFHCCFQWKISLEKEVRIINAEFGFDKLLDEEDTYYITDYLNLKIDEELAKGKKTDFDIIDEYVNRINCISEKTD